MTNENAILHAAVLMGGSDNTEYLRGICELLASCFPVECFPVENEDISDRAAWFEQQIKAHM